MPYPCTDSSACAPGRTSESSSRTRRGCWEHGWARWWQRAVYEVEKRLTKPLSPRWVKDLGFHTSMVRARDCGTPEELVHAIFQSSAAPPVFPVTLRNGHPALDGGLVENVPLSAVAECRRPLVLLSRHLRDLPRDGRELYACPSKPVPVSTWDFYSPDKVIETFELGRGDGTQFLGAQQARAPAW